MRITATQVESDLAALKLAAERAGTALACLFSSAEEMEADLIRERRAQGAYAAAPKPSRSAAGLRWIILFAALACALLLL